MAVLLRTDREGVRTLTLNRPEVRNALSTELLEALHREVAALPGSGARCVVLAGAGVAFCAGADLHELAARRGEGLALAQTMRTTLAELVEGLRAAPQPVVAKVHGDAVGAGLGLVLGCDLAYASATARLGAPFVKLGLVPDTGLSHLLPRRMGLARAKELVFTGQLLQATEAWEAGLINKFVPPPDLDDDVAALAARLAGMPPGAMADAKRLLQQGADASLSDALVAEAYAQGVRFTSAEHAEALQAFQAQRGRQVPERPA